MVAPSHVVEPMQALCDLFLGRPMCLFLAGALRRAQMRGDFAAGMALQQSWFRLTTRSRLLANMRCLRLETTGRPHLLHGPKPPAVALLRSGEPPVDYVSGTAWVCASAEHSACVSADRVCCPVRWRKRSARAICLPVCCCVWRLRRRPRIEQLRLAALAQGISERHRAASQRAQASPHPDRRGRRRVTASVVARRA